jgi:putative nucleotidyltransferase with HDIG domain
VATILIVDDRPANRQFLVTLLAYSGHRMLEAEDGAEALITARAEHPDLIITDILMPVMDGYEFARELRAAPDFDSTPVIFYTATYQAREARSLAEAAGVQYVLTKPAEPQAILELVNTALGEIGASIPSSRVTTNHLLDPLQVVSAKLTAKMGELGGLSLRLSELIELGIEIGAERDPQRLLEKFCESARHVLRAEYAAVGILEKDGRTLQRFITSGMDPETVSRLGPPPTGKGMLGVLLKEHQAVRLRDLTADPRSAGFPPGHPRMRSFLGCPIGTSLQIYGNLYLTEKIGAEEFSEEDERLALTLAAQVAVAYENAHLYYDIQRHAASLQIEISERRKAEAKIANQLQRLSVLRTIDLVITTSFDLRVTLEIILQHVVTQLQVDAAAILTYDPAATELEFAAGHGFRGSAIAGLRLRLGEDYAGRAALERRLIHIPDLSQAVHRLAKAELIAGEEFISFHAVPLVAKEKVMGVLEIFHRAPLDPDPDWLNFLQTLAGQTAIAIDNAELFNHLQRSNSDLIRAYDATIEGWSHALDLRDKETEGHTQRVTQMAMKLASAMGISEAELVHVRRGALLHDIGKMGVPDQILLKPAPLTEAEWEIMHRHPQFAYDMLSPIDFLHPALEIPYCHHEKWDGSGYPRGLQGERIPFAARIFSVVDVWDAVRSDRPYRPAWTQEKALEHIRSLSGTYFDPKVVQTFLDMRPFDALPDGLQAP